MSSFESSVVSPTQATSHQASPPTTQSNPDAEGSIFAHQKWNSTAHEPQLYLARLPTVTPASDINSARSLQLGVPRPKRKRITPEQLEVLSNLFEYTDTPTFDLREAIGAKLGMSNREVQVWFQNRRAKVNRQRAPTNTQATLQDRPPPSTSQQDPSRVTYGRLKCSSSEVLLPGVSTMIHSSTDASRSTYSLAPLLPPFQPTAPGVNSIQDGLVRRPLRDCSQPATRPSSPQDTSGSNRIHRSDLQLRSPSGSHRRIIPITPGSPYSRKWLPRRAPETSCHDHPAAPLSPRRSSTDPELQSAILPDHLPSHHPARSRWSSHATRSCLNSHVTSQRAQSHYLNIGSMKLDHAHADSAVNLNGYSLTRVPGSNDDNLALQLPEPQSASFCNDFPPNQASPSESNVSSRSSSPPTHHQTAQNRSSWQLRGGSVPSTAVHPDFMGSRDEGEATYQPTRATLRSSRQVLHALKPGGLAPQRSRPWPRRDPCSRAAAYRPFPILSGLVRVRSRPRQLSGWYPSNGTIPQSTRPSRAPPLALNSSFLRFSTSDTPTAFSCRLATRPEPDNYPFLSSLSLPVDSRFEAVAQTSARLPCQSLSCEYFRLNDCIELSQHVNIARLTHRTIIKLNACKYRPPISFNLHFSLLHQPFPSVFIFFLEHSTLT
ncbi:hypothetical protein Pst134EA_000840 [Puccinia striiformis f. sp. tritici]|uniref:hypothetical protein n=1 Tax=Puccinia striiformis f. sp. tritici TaxID=168172 RepID=UPI0020084688|nr:hypothetical protein Pst134EA_000840 [Puccinia striiformis f. sp. tritici]KAH9473772.1 hypothetical protein Pst134EA_000840 [Puccinia striiformis f. sp. tritici]